MASVVVPPVIEPIRRKPLEEPFTPKRPPEPLNLIGTDGADTLYGSKGNDIYLAGAGNDLINGSAGNDSLSGGTGIDTLDYSGLNADITFSRGGVITKSGGMGVDTIAAFDIEVIKGNANRINTIDGSGGTTAAINVDLSTNSLEITGLPVIGSAKLTVINFSNVKGSENNDVIIGDDKANTLNGGGGNDTISGGGGDDLLLGSSGSDVYRGGTGADTLSYEDLAGGITLVRGGTIIKADGSVDTIADFSVETIVGTEDAVNTIDGSTGVTAALNVDLSKQNLTITGLPFVGTAALTVKNFTDVKGSENADIITGDKGTNRLFGNAGNDLINGSAGNDSLSGGTGIDTLDYSGLNADITFSRGGVITKSRGMGVDTIAAFDIEVIKGNANRINTIDGSGGTTAAINVDLSTNSLEITGLPVISSAKLTVINFSNVKGSENNDVIIGDAKANTLNGGGGNDTISGGGGDDLLLGSSGSDIYRGATGADTLSYEAFAGGVTLVRGGTIIKADGSVDTIADFSVETIVGTKGAVNTIDGSTGVTAVLKVDLSKQNLTITGLPFVGTAALTVKNFTDVKGSENADVLTGDLGANRLIGNGGNDILAGLGGKDILTGGAGADTFVFGYGDSLLSGFDQITDLDIGVDSIDGWAATAVINAGRATSLNTNDLSKVLSGNNFLTNSATAFMVGSTGGDRTFLALNDSQLGFQAGKDLIVEITGYTGSLSNLTIV